MSSNFPICKKNRREEEIYYWIRRWIIRAPLWKRSINLFPYNVTGILKRCRSFFPSNRSSISFFSTIFFPFEKRSIFSYFINLMKNRFINGLVIEGRWRVTVKEPQPLVMSVANCSWIRLATYSSSCSFFLLLSSDVPPFNWSEEESVFWNWDNWACGMERPVRIGGSREIWLEYKSDETGRRYKWPFRPVVILRFIL